MSATAIYCLRGKYVQVQTSPSVSRARNISRSFVLTIKVWIIQITQQSDVLRSKCFARSVSCRIFLIKINKSHPSEKLLLLAANIKLEVNFFYGSSRTFIWNNYSIILCGNSCFVPIFIWWPHKKSCWISRGQLGIWAKWIKPF